MISCRFVMRLSWPQHLQASRTIERAADAQCGEALALMGMSLLILAEDLLASESGAAGGSAEV
jgi:hypothetical protein